MAILAAWRWTGYNMVLMLAGLQGISTDYYEAAMVDGASASEVAREAGIHTSQLFRWRQQLCERSPRVAATFQSVAIAPDAPMPTDDGVVEIEFAVGGRMRISGRVDASLVTSLANALATDRQTR